MTEKRTFKWGDSEYLLDDFLTLHAAQENNFYNFARDYGQYDDAAIQGLRQAIEKEINAAKNGEHFEADGSLATDVVDNVSIQTQKNGLFRKKEYTEQDNTAWAKYYTNKLISNLKKYIKKSKDKGWDMSKHGLSAYFNGQGLNAKEIFENYDKRDKDNPDNPRSFEQRNQLLKDQLINHKNWISNKNFNFSENDNEWDDNYISDLDDLIGNFDIYSQDGSLSSRLRKLGADDAYITAFTSDRFNLSKTNEELDEENKKLKEEENAKKEKEYLDEWENYSYEKKRESNPIYYTPFDYSAYDFNGKTANLINWYGDLNEKERSEYGTYLGRNNELWNNAWINYTNSLKGGAAYNDKNIGILLQGTLESQPQQFVDLGNGNYLIKDSVTDDGQGTIYNKSSGYTDTVFLGDLAANNDEIKNIYKQIAYKYINNKYGTNYDDRPDIFKNGGLIPKNQYGSKVIYNWETTDQSINPKSDNNNLSIETQKAKDQYMHSKNKSIDNPNAGWNAKHVARLGYAIADLGSAVAAFVPGAGTAASAGLGLTSTIGNFITDLTDDAVTGKEAWRNLGLNLGMDALGLIPGGGAASKMGKIIKSLKTTVPLIVALPGVANMLSNSPEIAKSWKRAFDGGSEDGGEKMTYQDYMNILQVLNVAAGATNIGKNVYNSSKRSIKQSDKLAIDVIEKGTNTRKALVLEGEDVTKFKEANSKGEAQKFVDELEGSDKYKINEITVSNKGKFWGNDANDKFHLFNQNPFGRTGTGKTNILEIKVDNKTSKLYADTGRWDGDLLDGDLIDSSANRRYKNEVSRLQEDVDATTNALKNSMRNRTKRTRQINSELTPEKAKLIQLQNRLRGVPDSNTLQSNKSQLETDLITLENNINIRQQALLNAESNLKRLINKKRVSKKNQKSHKAAIRAARGKIQGHKNVLQGYENRKQQYTSDINNIDDLLKAHRELPIAQSKVSRLEGILNQLNPSTHTNAYNKLRNMINNYQINHSNIEGRTINWDMNEILRNAGITNAFKQGGSINRNKLNKFLNYGKR